MRVGATRATAGAACGCVLHDAGRVRACAAARRKCRAHPLCARALAGRELYKHTYMAARWAFYRGVHKFEFWNEPDLSSPCVTQYSWLEYYTLQSMARPVPTALPPAGFSWPAASAASRRGSGRSGWESIAVRPPQQP